MSPSSTYGLARVRAAIGHYLLGRGAAAVAGFASAILLVRHMDVPSYAAYVAFFGVAGIAGLLSSLGLERAITRFVPEGKLFHEMATVRRFVWWLLSVQLLASLIVAWLLVMVWQPVVSLFDFVAVGGAPPPLVLYVVAASLTANLSTTLQALLCQKLLTKVTVIQWGARLVWILVLAFRADGVISLTQALWIMAIPETVLALTLAIALAWNLRRPETDRGTLAMPATDTWPKRGEVLALAGHSYGFNLLASPPQGYFMRTIVAATLPAETVAAYGFFSSLIDRLRTYLPMQLMYNLVEPVLVARYLENKDEAALARGIRLMYKMNLLIAVMGLLFLSIGGHSAVSLLTAGKYIEHAWILSLLVVQIAIGSHVLVIQLIANVLKKNEVLSYSAATALAAMFGLVAVAFAGEHPEWVLFGTLAYTLVMNTTAFWLLAKCKVVYRPPLWDVAKLLAIALGLALVANQFSAVAGPAGQRSMEILMAGTAALLLVAITLKFRYADHQELDMLQKLIRNRRST